jgi:hypothetical protein
MRSPEFIQAEQFRDRDRNSPVGVQKSGTVALSHVIVFSALFAGCTAVQADEVNYNADLVCSASGNLALARFITSENDEPPQFADLPPAFDSGLSKSAGSGRTDCTLSDGTAIRIREGEEQTFSNGMGGDDPPAFFSLWIGRRKVLSRFQWKPGYDNQDGRMLVGLVIGKDTLAYCDRSYQDQVRDEDGLVTCKTKSFDLTKFAADEEEYPANPKPNLPVGTVYVDKGSTNPVLCQLRLAYIKDGRFPDNWQGESQFERSTSVIYSKQGGTRYPFGALVGTFPNLANRQVFTFGGQDHYFDGNVVIIAPRDISLAKVTARFPPDDDAQNDPETVVAQTPPKGWTIIAGGSRSLYPHV